MLTLADIKRKYDLEFDTSGKLSQFAGLSVFLEFLKKCSLRERLIHILGEKPATAALEVLIGVIAGAKDMEEVARVGGDTMVKRYLRRPVSETQIVRNLSKLKRSDIESLHDFVCKSAVADAISHIGRDEFVDLDVDATPVEKYGQQEGVESGYVDRDTIRKCYQYQFFRVDKLNTILYVTIRGGSAHSQNGFIGYLERVLPCFEGRTARLRADSGYFSEAAFDVCAQFKADFFVKAPMSDSRKSQAESGDLSWSICAEDNTSEYACYDTVTKNGTPWREVFKRTRTDSDKRSLFPLYSYQCIATNDLSRSPWGVYSFYNQRARIEITIRELKNDYKLGHIVTQNFDVNDVITQMTILAYVMMQHFKRTYLDSDMQKMWLSSLRWRLFNIPGYLLSGARKRWHRIMNKFMNPQVYVRIFCRLEELLSVYFRPPSTAW